MTTEGALIDEGEKIRKKERKKKKITKNEARKENGGASGPESSIFYVRGFEIKNLTESDVD